jgi:dipeptidyl aminopeptidase/acylaminoacyl peptidase
LQVSNAAAGSGVYYWSTTARGIKRGHLAADLATQVMSETAVGPERCAGCHALSRDGTRLAFSNQMERLALVALPEQNELTFAALPPSAAMPAMPALSGPGGMAAPPMPTPMAMPMMPKKDAKPRAAPDYGWGTFNPAGTRLLYADKGKLHLIDVASGQEVGKVELQPGAAATHPDWAPDGRAVAVTYAPEGKKLAGNKQVLGTSIARLPVRDDGTLGAPEIIVASSGPEDTLFYPSYAPDGRWLAFVRAQGPAKDSASAQVYLTASDATTASSASAPVALENVAIGSSLPTWLPEIVAGQGFLAFSSTRDYGDVLVNTERDQLWAAAIDFKRLAAGADPSAPAFWLPFQDPLESNHRALWSVSANDVCPSLREQCNGRDDDCDGALDEDCCTPSAEICGDGIDNDCDGVPDEGCGCGTVDACDNQLDDDCDQKIDEDCRAL